jgi:hypothetical protein
MMSFSTFLLVQQGRIKGTDGAHANKGIFRQGYLVAGSVYRVNFKKEDNNG